VERAKRPGFGDNFVDRSFLLLEPIFAWLGENAECSWERLLRKLPKNRIPSFKLFAYEAQQRLAKVH